MFPLDFKCILKLGTMFNKLKMKVIKVMIFGGTVKQLKFQAETKILPGIQDLIKISQYLLLRKKIL